MNHCELCDCSFKLRLDMLRHMGTKKHLAHFNPEQQEVILALLELMQSKSKDGLRINSAGGTGKTYYVSGVLDFGDKVVCLAPTNQAVNVLQKQFDNAMTFHKFFGWAQYIDENDNEVSTWRPPTIPEDTIFVLDEISMMTRAQYSLFKHYIHGKHAFILMGDQCQLPPFETKGVDDDLPDGVELVANPTETSLFFQFDCKEIALVKNMRTRDQELKDSLADMRQRVLDGDNIRLINNSTRTEMFSLIKDNIQRDYLVVAFLREDVDRLNREIREYLNPQKINSQAEIGDKIRLDSYYRAFEKERGIFTPLQSGSRWTITYVKEEIKQLKNIFDDEVIDLPCYYIELNNLHIIHTIKRDFRCVFQEYKKRNSKQIAKIKSKKKQPMTEKEVKETKIKHYTELRRRCAFACFWDYGFASTINKAQGGNYDLVFVYNKAHGHFGNKRKYTACSRVVNELKIFG